MFTENQVINGHKYQSRDFSVIVTDRVDGWNDIWEIRATLTNGKTVNFYNQSAQMVADKLNEFQAVDHPCYNR